MNTKSRLNNMVGLDLLTEGRKDDLFIGTPFVLDYFRCHVLVNDDRKFKAKGIPQGTFLLAYYENEPTIEEAVLLRALGPAKLPTDTNLISSMIEYYKDGVRTSGTNSELDALTKFEFSFSGLECRVLGTFFRKEKDSKTIEFGADLENFYSAHHYRVYKVDGEALKHIVNQRDSQEPPGGNNESVIGRVRFSSTTRFQSQSTEVKVYINPRDFLGKRTALFGMTRTGKSNTVKKLIDATCEISAKTNPLSPAIGSGESLKNYEENGLPKFAAGQIIFDINGEYANANLQDDGTAIYEKYSKIVKRYSVIEKPGFEVMKVNFYGQVTEGFELIKNYLEDEKSAYMKSFLSIDLVKPDDPEDHGEKIRFDRKIAAYQCCLKAANFPVPANFKVTFPGRKEINNSIASKNPIYPEKGISLDEATQWFSWVWDNYEKADIFHKYKKEKGREWADEDLKSLLVFLTRKSKSSGRANVSGYKKIRSLRDFHTPSRNSSFDIEILKHLRTGRIVIIDLSQGNPKIQRLYSERITGAIFRNSMKRFIDAKPNNFIQFYFEEAHNLFPKKEDKDLSQIYNRLAKEGAKLNLGMLYATQEVSSISSNILKNTQNWFISHLNNEDETKELNKYYDFSDFTKSLIRFSSKKDKGFVRMKTYSTPFIVPVQIDRFTVKEPNS